MEGKIRMSSRMLGIVRRVAAASKFDEVNDSFAAAQATAAPEIAGLIPQIAIQSVWAVDGLSTAQLKSVANFLGSLDASCAQYVTVEGVIGLMKKMASAKVSLDDVSSPKFLLCGTLGGDIEGIRAYRAFVKENYQSRGATRLMYLAGGMIERMSMVKAGAVLTGAQYNEVLGTIMNDVDAQSTVGRSTQQAFKDKFFAKFVNDYDVLKGGGLKFGLYDDKLERMSRSKDEYVRAYAAGNRKTPVDALKRLARDPENVVRYCAGNNPSLPLDVSVSYDSSDIPWEFRR